MATVYEIVQALTQASANAYDGAHRDDKPIEIGLRREEGDPLIDKRVIDGFNVRFGGNVMTLSYQTECSLKEVYAGGFEGEMEQKMADIVKFLKKEAKSLGGGSISLKPVGEIDIRVENSSRIRSWATACMNYEVSGLEEVQVVGESVTDSVASGWETFLKQGGLGKRPPNDKRPLTSGDKK